jgi:hypothetical protein
MLGWMDGLKRIYDAKQPHYYGRPSTQQQSNTIWIFYFLGVVFHGLPVDSTD